MVEFEIVYRGERADEGLIDFYDGARALAGFQRSLALTVHLALNGEVATQAPSTKGFQILIPPFERGSWKSKALLIFTTGLTITSVGKDSPMGQIVTSLYDVVLSSTMGFHVDYNKTLQQQYRDYLTDKKVTPERIDSLCEKVEGSIADMHRPIVASETASQAEILRCGHTTKKIGPDLNALTYEYVKQTIRRDKSEMVTGFVAIYNVNTFKGRLFSLDEQRLIPFELLETARNATMVGLVTRSQHFNGQTRSKSPSNHGQDSRALINMKLNELVSPSGVVKRYLVSSVISASALP